MQSFKLNCGILFNYKQKECIPMISDSILTCPHCDAVEKTEMPENTCQYSYTCQSCNTVIKTRKGECCVYCSYGDYPCPTAQLIGSACCSPD